MGLKIESWRKDNFSRVMGRPLRPDERAHLLERVHEVQWGLFKQATTGHWARKYNLQIQERTLPIHWRLFMDNRTEWICKHRVRGVPLEFMCLFADKHNGWNIATKCATPLYMHTRRDFPWDHDWDFDDCTFDHVWASGDNVSPSYEDVVHEKSLSRIERFVYREWAYGEQSVGSHVFRGLLSNPLLSYEHVRTLLGAADDTPSAWGCIMHNSLDALDEEAIEVFCRDLHAVRRMLEEALPSPIAMMAIDYMYPSGPQLLSL
jgi:hypothetical protein